MQFVVHSEAEMKSLGRRLGEVLEGGEVLELVGDVGAGKTTLTKGLAEGLSITDPIQSPTFTISRVYAARDGLTLYHYDFYRLGEAGIMAEDVSEVMDDGAAITVIEWASAVSDVLPRDHLRIEIAPTSEHARSVRVETGGERSQKVAEALG